MGGNVFTTLYKASQNGELILIKGGIAEWHLRRDNQITLRTFLSTRLGAGSEMLDILKKIDGATSIFAKCNAESGANKWYEKKGFVNEGSNVTSNGLKLNHWRLVLTNNSTSI